MFINIVYFKSIKLPAKLEWVRIIVGNLLIILLIFLVTFLVLETYYRYFYDTTESFALSKVSDRWFKRYYKENKAGFRDNIEYYTKCKHGKLRVTFIGDSFTAGHGIKNVENRFANLIGKYRPNWEIHVMARNGLDTKRELALLLSLLKETNYTFNIVVLVYCINDISDSVPEWNNHILGGIYKEYYNQGFLLKNSYLINTFYFRYKGMKDPNISSFYRFVFKYYNGQIWEKQKELLKSINKNIKENNGNNGKLLVVTFPFLHALGNNYKYKNIHEKLNDFWIDEGVPHLDLMQIFQSNRNHNLVVNRWDAHPNEFAHKLVSKHIMRFIEQNISKNNLTR